MSKIQESKIQLLHPTQLTVGMIEVHKKQKHLSALKATEQRDFMQAHPAWIQRLSEHKVQICERNGNDRQAYMDGKAEMVRQITKLAGRRAA